MVCASLQEEPFPTSICICNDHCVVTLLPPSLPWFPFTAFPSPWAVGDLHPVPFSAPPSLDVCVTMMVRQRKVREDGKEWKNDLSAIRKSTLYKIITQSNTLFRFHQMSRQGRPFPFWSGSVYVNRTLVVTSTSLLQYGTHSYVSPLLLMPLPGETLTWDQTQAMQSWQEWCRAL